MRNIALLGIISLFGLSPLHSESTVGCAAIEIPEASCTDINPLKKQSFELTTLTTDKINTTNEPQISKTETIDITPDLSSITLKYQNSDIHIERTPHTEKQSCPPYCIQPMQIDKVKTVGELETLTFIKALSKKTGALVIDARLPFLYKQETLPTATNIPYTLLQNQSPHETAVLKLLGAKKVGGDWKFDNVRELLLFDSALWDFQASTLIKQLIKVGYPQDHLNYYRGGLRSWKEAGLSLYSD